MNIIMKRNIYILCNKKMKLLFTMNIDSLSMWRIIISILESRIKSAYQFGEQVETCRIWHEREFHNFLEKLRKNVINFVYNIEQKEKKYIHITDKHI